MVNVKIKKGDQTMKKKMVCDKCTVLGNDCCCGRLWNAGMEWKK